MLDDLIREALLEAAAQCVVPEELDQLVLYRISEGDEEPGSGGGIPDG